MDYIFNEIEKKWQEHWEKINLANCDVSLDKNNFYNLCMYPYPLEIYIWDMLEIIQLAM